MTDFQAYILIAGIVGFLLGWVFNILVISILTKGNRPKWDK